MPTLIYRYLSIQQIESTVTFGSAASITGPPTCWSITVFLHLLRILFTGRLQGRSYGQLDRSASRCCSWCSGANFTGYLLPWDQLAYWADGQHHPAGLCAAGGDGIQQPAAGRSAVGQGALSNFYALHVVFIPCCWRSVSLYHFWKVRKNGGASPSRSPARANRSERT